MTIEVKVPSAGESVTEVTLLKWSRPDGAWVERDDPIAEIETDKANADVPAPAAGVLRTMVAAGVVVKVGQVIASVDPAGKAAGATQPTGGAAVAGSTAAGRSVDGGGAVGAAGVGDGAAAAGPADLWPATRRVVAETGIDPATVVGTGRGGRLTKPDVIEAASRAAAGATPALGAARADPSAVVAGPPVVGQRPGPAKPPVAEEKAGEPAAVRIDAREGTRRTPMSKIRRRIAENLVAVKQRTAMLTTFNEVDLSAISGLRARYKEGFEKKHAVGLGFMSFFVRAVCVAVREFERVNGQLDGGDIVLFDHVHMGVAVSTDRGLTVPVLKHADKMSFAGIESEIKRLAGAAREGKLALEELSGGTFTITNGGVFGSLLSTPIINGNQSAILGMHAIQQRPVAIEGKVEVRPMMYVALSYDHRIVDGRESVSFLVRIKQLLEDPARLMLDV